MAKQKDFLKTITSHCKEYGFIFPSSEIYDGLSATYDYGPNGAELKNNIKDFWWRSIVQLNDNIFGLDSAIFMHSKVWEASGHLKNFHDPMVDNKDSKKRYRADNLIEDKIEQLHKKRKKEKAESLQKKFNECVQNEDLEGLGQLLEEFEIADPETGSRNWSEVRQFNLMFKTQLGSVEDKSSDLYLRPETAQGIYINYLNVQKTARAKLPFGIAQTGKAFRNEIIARQFLFRMREFEQMEMQYFVKPGEEEKWYDYWKEKRMLWHKVIGLNPEKLQLQEHENLAHYAEAATDVEYQFPFGFKEIEGIHSRTDFDLSRHEEYSGKKLKYFDPATQESFTPYVVETSLGLDRVFLALLTTSLIEETVDEEKGQTRTVLKLPPFLAPVKLAILPLTRKDGLPEESSRIFNELKFDFNCFHEEKDSIGKRYRRQDAIGTPYCITVDHQTLEDQTVTIRDRDTMEQERIPVDQLRSKVLEKISVREALQSL